jgi:hypothetical protein
MPVHRGGAVGNPTHAQARLSRRTLLSGSVASLALPWVLRGARAAAPRLVCDVSDEAAWEELTDKIKCGIVVRPNDPRFVRLTQPENLRYYNPPATSDAPPDSDAPFGVVVPQRRRSRHVDPLGPRTRLADGAALGGA